MTPTVSKNTYYRLYVSEIEYGVFIYHRFVIYSYIHSMSHALAFRSRISPVFTSSWKSPISPMIQSWPHTLSRRVDIHSHTTASDGIYTSDQVVRHARDRWIEILATTDHDIVTHETRDLAKACGIESYLGAEVSVDEWGKHLHILAYTDEDFDPDFYALLERTRSGRSEKVDAQCRALGARGYRISIPDDRFDHFGSSVVPLLHRMELFSLEALRRRYSNTNPENLNNVHIAKALYEVSGNRKKLREDTGDHSIDSTHKIISLCLRSQGKYASILGQDREIPRYEPTIAELQWALGGTRSLLSLAHPQCTFDTFSWAQAFLDRTASIWGIEIASTAWEVWTRSLMRYARDTWRIMTFGSDFHGEKNPTHGNLWDMNTHVTSGVIERHVDMFRRRIWA